MRGIKVSGVVECGRRLGRTIGFPTVNLALPEGVELADGVYRSQVEFDGRCYAAMSNVGCNPSVGGAERRIETHLFDFEGDLYGRRIKVELFEKLREECRFPDLEALRRQLEADKQQILNQLNKQ